MAAAAGVEDASWTVELDPAPVAGARPIGSDEAERTLAALGVLPGTTIRFRRGR